MKKLYLIVLLISFFAIHTSVFAQAPISINIVDPKLNGVSGDAIFVAAKVTSTYSLDTVKATIAGRSILLTYQEVSMGIFAYAGTLSLTGLSEGTQTVTFHTHDVLGNTQNASINFYYDKPPVVTLQSPANNTTYQAKLHIKAAVSDPGHTHCNGIVTAANVGSAGSTLFSFNFVNSIDTLLDVFPVLNWGTANITITAIDSLQVSTSKTVTVYNDKSPFLAQVYADTSGGQIIDAVGQRLLVSSSSSGPASLKIVNLADNSVQTIQGLNSKTLVSGKLTGSGAVMILGPIPDVYLSDSLFVWSNNTLTNISKQQNVQLGSHDYMVNGDNFIWYSSLTEDIRLTNAATLSTKVVDNNSVLNNGNYIDSLGNISYSAARNIYTYNIITQAKIQITNDAASSFNTYSAVDGSKVFFVKLKNAVGDSTFHFFDGLADHTVGKASPISSLPFFDLRNGYAAFSMNDSGHIPQVYLRRPDTSLTQMSFFSSQSRLDKLGNKGSLLFANASNRYYADSLTTFKSVSGQLGSTFYINNNFYLAIGNTLFRYKNLTASNVAPNIASFTPTTAGKGATVKIKGTGFSTVTAVNFGGINANSFAITGDTTIMAVVGTGATGSVSVTAYSGATSTLAGFTFDPLAVAPTIASFTPAIAGTGMTITITGTNFTGATVVSFGGTTATSFTVISPTEIQAVVSTGASGNVTVTKPTGTATQAGFIYLATPIISYTASSPTFLTGQSILLMASTRSVYTYQWTLDGVVINGATGYDYNASKAGTYTVSIVEGASLITSQPLQVTEQFMLASNDINITTTDATCKGSKNGSIAIVATAAVPNYNYNAEVSGNGIDSVYHFAGAGTVTSHDLGAGTYNVCITVDGQSDFKQCYTALINEPKDLSLYTSVDQTVRTVTLSLNGGDLYNVTLNGAQYTTTQSALTLHLLQGDNLLSVATDRTCQGIITQHISAGNDIILSPNPIDNILNISLGKSSAKSATVQVRDLNGNLIYSKVFATQYGGIQVDLSALESGIHVLKLQLDSSVSIFKIIKK